MQKYKSFEIFFLFYRKLLKFSLLLRKFKPILIIKQ